MENMRYTWDLYFKSIHLMMILSGATIAVLMNLTLGNDNAAQMTHKYLSFYSMVSAGIAGGIALAWRFMAQVLCEKQLYYPSKDFVDYFKRTKTWVAYSLDSDGLVKICRWGADTCKLLSAVFIALSWGVALTFVGWNISVLGP